MVILPKVREVLILLGKTVSWQRGRQEWGGDQEGEEADTGHGWLLSEAGTRGPVFILYTHLDSRDAGGVVNQLLDHISDVILVVSCYDLPMIRTSGQES